MNVTKVQQLHSQKGIALITVMLVLAVVTVALVSMSSDRQMDIRRTENQLRSTQAWEYVYGLEAWCANQLKLDAEANQYDAVNDSWSKPLSVNPIPEGNLEADIIELQGRINLNNLLLDGKVSEEDVQRLKRLFTILEIKADLVDALLDWIDADMKITMPQGAEDETYGKLKPPYRSANVAFADLGELLRVKGMTLKIYNKLLPYIYVADGYQPININTASAVVLRTLAADIKKSQAESLFRASGKPFKDIEEFLKDEALEGLNVNKESISVNSHNFLLSGKIDMTKTVLMFMSQLKRDDLGEVKVLKRLRRSLQNG